MTKAFPSLSRLMLAAVAGALVSIGAANAATIKLTFDPSFGFAFQELGFSGEALLDVAPACMSLTGDITPSGSCTVTVTDAFVDLYNLVVDPGQTTPVQQLVFAPPPLPSNTVNDIVNEVILMNNQVVSVGTKIFGSQLANPITYLTTGDVFPGGNAWLQFVSGYAVNPDTGLVSVDPHAFLYIGDNCNTNPTGCSKSDPATVIVSLVESQEIPEPGTLALIAVGLGLLGLVARRRRIR